MTMTIRLASTIVLIGLQETNTIGYYKAGRCNLLKHMATSHRALLEA
jgi:hypothetical protein